MPFIYSIIGPNGAGKSTSAQLFAEVEHFDFDAKLYPLMKDIEQEILEDDVAFEVYCRESIKDVQNMLLDWSNKIIEDKISFSLAHNFFPGHNSNDPIIKKACENGYIHKVIYVGITNIETCIRRVQLRAAKGYHNISDAEIKERYEKGLIQLNNLL